VELPRSQRYGNGWTLVWDQLQIGMAFEKVHDTRDDGISARLVIRSQRPDTARQLAGPTNLNLLAATSQTTLANSLERRVKDVPWHEMLTTACALVVTQYTTPSPVLFTDQVELDDMLLEALVPGPGGIPLIPLDETTFCYGDSESLKSFLCQVIVSCVHHGIALPWGELPTRKMKVLYLDWETNEVVIADRMARIAAGLQVDPVHMAYRGFLRTRQAPPLRMLADEIDNVREYVEREEVGLVVVDSIGFAVSGKLTDDDVARSAMGYLRQLPCTRLVVAHISKESAQQARGRVDPFGSAFFRAGLRSGFEVRRSEEQQLDGAVNLAVYHWKSNDGEHVRPFGLRVDFDGPRGPVKVSTQRIDDVPDLAARGSLLARLQAAMRGGAVTIYEVAEEVDEPTDNVAKTFRRYRDKVFTQVDKGGPGKPARWGLIS
jgi:hypothetical protein